MNLLFINSLFYLRHSYPVAQKNENPQYEVNESEEHYRNFEHFFCSRKPF